MILKDLVSPFYVWKRAFSKPYTARKPIDERPGAPSYRGFHINDLDKCIGCGTCESICQNAAIDMVPVEGVETTMGDSGLRPRIDYGRCCWCALCVDVCTTESLRMSNHYIWVDTDPDNFLFVPGAEEKPWDKEELGYRRSKGYQLLNFKRAEMGMMRGEEGLTSFNEMVFGFSREQALYEAQRCTDCGLCIAQCPAHMDIPDYIREIRNEDYEAAFRIMYRTNPFTATCGRICTHRCENVCSVGHLGDPVAIRWLKRYITDQIPKEKMRDVLEDEIKTNGKKVAIIGAGPGGLSCAYYLVRMGYEVELHEKQPKAGGALRYGVPAYRLPYDQLDKDIDYIVSLGVKLHTDSTVGQALFEEMLEKFDAVFFSTGLSIPSALRVDGEVHPRVLSGLQVLEDVTKGKDPHVGKNVAVIGGGNVAMDSARVSRRMGANVTLLYRRRIVDMPADTDEIHESREEGVTFVTQAIPVKIENAADPNQVVIHWGEAKMVPNEKGGRPRPVLIEDKIHVETYDSIISAIGQSADYSFLTPEHATGIQFKWGNVISNTNNQTGIPKVFVGGDIANDTADAISAIADGHNAARGIDRFLFGK
ncbi:MAG: FAD-dependent oxidoreductase [bacterium]